LCVLIAGVACVASVAADGNCCEHGSEEADFMNAIVHSQSCTSRYQECQKEKSGSNCNSNCDGFSVNNDALESVDNACLKLCSGYAAAQGDFKKSCQFIKDAKNEVDSGSCCTGIDKIAALVEISSELTQCTNNGFGYEYGCCNTDCRAPCKNTHEERKSTTGAGIGLIILGVILSSIFCCGLKPCCCFEKKVVQAPPVAIAAVPAQLAVAPHAKV
jgi:hypothetical protein